MWKADPALMVSAHTNALQGQRAAQASPSRFLYTPGEIIQREHEAEFRSGRFLNSGKFLKKILKKMSSVIFPREQTNEWQS